MAEEEIAAVILEPPPEAAVICNCGDLVGYIEIPATEELTPAVVHPCHCELTPKEVEDLLVRNHPNLKDPK